MPSSPVAPAALVFDIDGTLVPHAGEPHASLLPILRDCAKRGHPLFVATARRRSSALMRLGPLADLLDQGIYNNGACTWLDGQLHSHVALPIDLAAAAYAEMATFTGVSGASLALADERIAFNRQLLDHELAEWGVVPEHLCRVEEALAIGPIRLCAWSETTDLSPLLHRLEARFGTACVLQLVDRGHCLFVTPLGVDKRAAVASLCAHHGICQTQVIAFGDDLSDIAMLRWAGIGVAMQNGHPDARHSADQLAPDSAEGGVGQVLRDLLDL